MPKLPPILNAIDPQPRRVMSDEDLMRKAEMITLMFGGDDQRKSKPH